MSTRARLPWSFEDGASVAERILRDYARWRLDTLPFLQDAPQMSDALIEGYRRLDAERAEAERKVIAVERLIDRKGSCSALRRDAQEAWELWDLTHRWLVAIELDRLHQTTSGVDELKLVLLAEQRVEALVNERDKGSGFECFDGRR